MILMVKFKVTNLKGIKDKHGGELTHTRGEVLQRGGYFSVEERHSSNVFLTLVVASQLLK